MIPDGLLLTHVTIHPNTVIRETVPDHITLAFPVDLRNNNWFEDGFLEPGKEETGESCRFRVGSGILGESRG